MAGGGQESGHQDVVRKGGRDVRVLPSTFIRDLKMK